MDFFQLIREGDLDAIKSEVTQNKNLLYQKNDRGFPPLVMASYGNHIDVVQYLIREGVNVDELDMAGNTALMGVCFKGYFEIVKLLLENGADVNIQNSQGSTALIYAAKFGHSAIAKELLAAGADKSIKDAKGNDAAIYAKIKGIVELASILE